MEKLFSVVSWNVEHFKGKSTKRIKSIISMLSQINPDIFALYEVEGKKVYLDLTRLMVDYSFHITEGPQTQEILVGVKHKFPSFFTQKVEFKSGNKYLRPGALLSVTINDEDYTLLFLHTKSSKKPIGLGIRDDMFRRACKLRRKLDKMQGSEWKSNYIFMGDLNTMGMDYPYKKDISPDIEIKKLALNEAKKVKMRLLEKDEPSTWWNGSKSKYKPSDLDQVIAAEHLKFKKYPGFNNKVSAEITVLGWPKETTDKNKDRWIENYSDHGILYFELQK